MESGNGGAMISETLVSRALTLRALANISRVFGSPTG
jgi:hypothetical protein